MAALVSEVVPTGRRRSLVAVIWSGFPTGAAAGALVVPFVVEAFGWEVAIFLCAAIAATIFLAIAGLLPESVRFLANSGRDQAKLVQYCNYIEPNSVHANSAFARETVKIGRASCRERVL